MSDNGYTDYGGIFLNVWATVPVFHGYDFGRNGKDESGIYRDWTRCGRVISSYDPETRRHTDNGTMLPIQHARKFGRPCKRCFA